MSEAKWETSVAYRDPGLASITHLIAKWWGQELCEGSRNPELRVAKRIAEHYAQRAEMDGEVVRSTGEVIPKESV